MQKLRYIICTTCFITIQILAGVDVDNALEQVNNSIAIDVLGFNLDYKEKFLPTDIAGLKSTEAGNIIGVVLEIRNIWVERIYTDLYFDYCRGKLKYDGSTQPPRPQPLEFKAEHRFFTANIKAGPVFTFTDDQVLQLIPYISVGYRYWYRHADNIAGNEKYQDYKITGGLRINWLVTEDLILSPYIAGGKIFNANMKFYGKNDSSDGFNYKLGNKPTYEGGIELNYRLFDEFFLNSFVTYSQFKYGRSATQSDRTYEPDSDTREIKVGLGIRYSWLVNN